MESLIATLLSALIAVESGGQINAVGDNGRAVGVLQIHACCVEDVNRITGKTYTLQDRTDEAKSREICTAYLLHYGRVYERRTGEKATAEILARIWNGGPRGHKKNRTLRYWGRVQSVME